MVSVDDDDILIATCWQTIMSTLVDLYAIVSITNEVHV